MTDFSSCIHLHCFQFEKQGKTHRSSSRGLSSPSSDFCPCDISEIIYIYIHTPILKKEKNVRSWRYYKDENRSSAYIPRVRITLIQCQSVANQTVDPPSRNEPTTLKKKKKKKRTYLSTSTFGSAFIAASRMLGSRCGSAAGENGLVGLVVMY